MSGLPRNELRGIDQRAGAARDGVHPQPRLPVVADAVVWAAHDRPQHRLQRDDDRHDDDVVPDGSGAHRRPSQRRDRRCRDRRRSRPGACRGGCRPRSTGFISAASPPPLSSGSPSAPAWPSASRSRSWRRRRGILRCLVSSWRRPMPRCRSPPCSSRLCRRKQALRIGALFFAYTVFIFPLGIVVIGGLLEREQRRARDEAELRTLNAALSLQAEREQGVFESSGVAIAWVDLPTGRLIRANPQYAKFTGYSEAELTNKRFDELAVPEERESDVAAIKVARGRRADLRDRREALRAQGRQGHVGPCARSLRSKRAARRAPHS